jgi:CRP-like cAMP-binding protein
MWSRHRGVGERRLLDDLPPSLRLDVLSELTRDLLGQVSLFRYAPPALRDELVISLKPIVFPPGADIARAGEVGDGIYFVAAGDVEVLSPDDDSVQTVLPAGSYFGDLTLMLGERRTATVRSRGFTETFQLSASDFERIREAYPELREVMTKASKERSSAMAELVLEGVVL